MPFEVNIEHRRGRIVSTWRGRIDEARCAEYVEAVWGDPTVSAYDELVDFRAVTAFGLEADAIRGLVTRARRAADPVARARSVFVASEPEAFGLSRMYVSMRDVDDEHRRKWQVVDDYAKAVAWLAAGRGTPG